MSTAAESCMICLDGKFNKTTKTKSTCLFCNEVICRECLKASLLNDTSIDVCCPGCRAVWPQDFLVTNLPANFRTSSLKKHREKILYDREKAQLPMHMEDARRYKTAKDELCKLRQELDALKAKYMTFPDVCNYKNKKKAWKAIKHGVRSTIWSHTYNEFIAASGLLKKNAEAVKIKEEMSALKRKMNPFTRAVNTFGAPAPEPPLTLRIAREPAPVTEEPAERRIVMGCPAAGCNGFVNTLWKCGMCDTKVCKDCHIIKTTGHACKPDDIATAAAISADTKPCPKCATAISKISGCDQMWCTMCHTTFSWKTGKIETSVIHNPHYFQWMAANGRTIPRADLPGLACDIDNMTMRAVWRYMVESGLIEDAEERAKRRRDLDTISERHRHRLDMEAIQLRRIRNNVRQYMEGTWRRELCVKRLSGDISETEWQIALQRAEKAHHKERAWMQLMEMYALTSRDILGRIATETEPNISQIVEEHERLHVFVVEQSVAISKAYQCIVLKVTPDMTVPEKKKRVTKKPTPAMGGAGGPSD